MNPIRESGEGQPRDLATMDRIIWTAAGSQLLLTGLARRRSRLGMAIGALGGYLAYRGLSGRRPRHRWKTGSTTGELLRHPLAREIEATATLTIDRPPDALYEFWRDFRNLPQIMPHIDYVEVLDERHSRWRFEYHKGSVLEWEAMIVQDRPGELLEWTTVNAGNCRHQGSVEFNPSSRGTVVRVKIVYTPIGGAAGALLARIFRREPAQMLRADLRRFKQLMETGEITDNTSPSAREVAADWDYDVDDEEDQHGDAGHTSEPAVVHSGRSDEGPGGEPHQAQTSEHGQSGTAP